ncbi:unnamed protein product, partial [Symbiodinium sp. CCMP2592]
MCRRRGWRMKATSDELSNEGLSAKASSGTRRRRRNRHTENRNENSLTMPCGKQRLVWRPKSGTCGEQLPNLDSKAAQDNGGLSTTPRSGTPPPDPEHVKPRRKKVSLGGASTATGGTGGPSDSEDVGDGECQRGLLEGPPDPENVKLRPAAMCPRRGWRMKVRPVAGAG